ncbi:zinc finger FYVE domain-containing protein 26 homolog [Euwallacea similis]|uniref:zinc finger FYVE domain-containing protein 26 homolog n=1 Tax=Euwallacea similis TaxID=1736056 RepID=UPI00344FB59A
MRLLLEDLEQKNCASRRDKFYKNFSSVSSRNDNRTITHQIIPKVFELMEKQFISKTTLYLSLLINENIHLLEKCHDWEKTKLQSFNIKKAIEDPNIFYNYTVYTRKHWFGYLISNWPITLEVLTKAVCDKLLFVNLIQITNERDEKSNRPPLNEMLKCCPTGGVDDFWIYCIQCVRNFLNLYTWCQDKICHYLNINQFLHYASQNCVLATISQYLAMENYCDYLQELFARLLGSKTYCLNEDLNVQNEMLLSFAILLKFYQLILYSNYQDFNANEIIEQIQTKYLTLKNHNVQIELLQLILTSLFMKRRDVQNDINTHVLNEGTSEDAYVCNENEVRLTLNIARHLIKKIQFSNAFEHDSVNLEKLKELHKVVSDAAWRLDLIVSVVKACKIEAQLMHYMLAPPESLIKLCLKNEDFDRTYQVLKIFNLENTPLAKEIIFTEKLKELKYNFLRAVKLKDVKDASGVTSPSMKLHFERFAEEFFLYQSSARNIESEKVFLENTELYPFLENYQSDRELFMYMLDLSISQVDTCEDSKVLLHLSSSYDTLSGSDTGLSKFARVLIVLLNEAGESKSGPLSSILLNPQIDFHAKIKTMDGCYQSLQNLYTRFCQSLYVEEMAGNFSKDHSSHAVFNSLFSSSCLNEAAAVSEDAERVKYLQKLFNYLQAFSEVLYIEVDASDLISKGKNCSFFNLLFYNRSELMGHLLFEKNLEPTEYEKYFSKLKLDFLYHVAGNCFPTINLHSHERITKEELYPENILYPPNPAVINYIKRRNWLIALLLIEMHKVKEVELEIGVSRIQNFINYLRLPRIQNLQPIFKYNEIMTGLQNEIHFQQVHDFVYSEIGKRVDIDSTHSSGSRCIFDAAEEIEEDKLKSTNWKHLYLVIESISDKQLRKNRHFKELRDMLLVNLVRDGVECEYYKYVMKIHDKAIRINMILDYMKVWPEDFCINSLKYELTRFDLNTVDRRLVELVMWLKHIEHSKRIMTLVGIDNSTSLYEMCALKPKELLQKLLLSTKEVDTIIDFIQLHDVSTTLIASIDEAILELAFDVAFDTTSIAQLLSLLPENQAIRLCANLVKVLKDIQQLQFITEYLKEHSYEIEDLPQISLSLGILSVFNHSDFDQQLLFLIRDPLSIIEVLIMNTMLDKLGLAWPIIKSSIQRCNEECEENLLTVDMVDGLLRTYAEKSLDFRVIAQPEPRLLRTPEHKLLQSLDSIQLDPDNKGFLMPEEVPKRCEWTKNCDVIECPCCQNTFFSMFNRRHHCRRCGRIICSGCSKKRMIVPTYGDITVRVCNDCFMQIFSDVSDDSMSTESLLDDYWMLTSDAEHNRIVREEFSYEFAPSVSLCLSLMKFHSKCDEYSRFLLDQCDILLKLLIPNQEPLQEIDYRLVIRMLKSLALASKMAAHDNNSQVDTTAAERILRQAELLDLFAERGCLNFLPISGNATFIDSISLMRLIDKLLETEQWSLALEVSTKAGIDKSGVFAAWGISCLKAGNLAIAREIFGKCFDKNLIRDSVSCDLDSLKVIKNPPLLTEIIKILESKKEIINEQLVMDHQRLLGSSVMTLNQSIMSGPQPESAVFIMNKLKNLKNIECGYYPPTKKSSSPGKTILEPVIYDECVYYLTKYGTAVSLVEFHIKYGQFGNAAECILKKQLSLDAFIHIYMKCLRGGAVMLLQARMAEMDPTLTIWKDHLIKICSHMAKQNLLNSLYQLQLYMGDYVRAAMTCVKFYEENVSSFTDLFNNSYHLKESLKHLVQAKEQEQWITVSPVTSTEVEPAFEETSIASPLVKKMAPENIEKHTITIMMQLQVAHFFSDQEKNGLFPVQVFLDIYPHADNVLKENVALPTLFGSESQRTYIAILCLVCSDSLKKGFDLALKIGNEFKLRLIKVYKEATKYFAQNHQFSHITELVACIQDHGGVEHPTTNEICDEILIFAVATLKNDIISESSIEELIKLICDRSAKISAYIEAKQLKTAYFLATKHKRVVDLKRIMREAEISNQRDIKALCQKAINKYSYVNSCKSEK